MSAIQRLFALLVAVVPAFAMASEPAAELRATLEWRISLDANGHITAMVPKGDAIAALRLKLEAAVRSWEFEPGKIEGRAAATETLLSVQVALTPVADGSEYTVRIRDARTGGGIAKAEAPRFSAAAVKRLMGRSTNLVRQIVVEVSYDASGKATSIAVVPGSQVTEGPLLDGVENALRKSRFEPERIDGVAIAGKVVTPTCLAVSSGSADARKLARACTWSLPGSEASLESGQSVALDSSVQIKTSVVGSML